MTLAIPRSVRWSGAAGPGSTSAGACQAPQTTATFSRPALDRRADRLAHEGLAALLARVVVRERLAQRAHRLGDGLEGVQALAAGLDHVLPPALGVAVPRGLRQRPQRIGARPAVAALALGGGHLVRGRQVHEAHGHAAVERVPHRPPLRREARERVERGARGLVGHVGEQRDRRRHVLPRGQLDQAVGLGRALDQDRVGLELEQRAFERAGRAGAVVADPEDGVAHNARQAR